MWEAEGEGGRGEGGRSWHAEKSEAADRVPSVLMADLKPLNDHEAKRIYWMGDGWQVTNRVL